jgi:hypothetical protein
MLVSKAVDRGIIGGVMVSILVSKEVDRGFIGGLMISVHEPTIYRFRGKNANHYATNELTSYCFREKR